MIPYIVAGLVQVIQSGHEWLSVWHEKHKEPAKLSGNALSLFQQLKAAYDLADTDKLGAVIADSYRGTAFGAKNKKDFISLQKRGFDQLRLRAKPCLKISVYQIIEDSATGFRAIIGATSDITWMKIPLTTLDIGTLICEARPIGKHGIWRIVDFEEVN